MKVTTKSSKLFRLFLAASLLFSFASVSVLPSPVSAQETGLAAWYQMEENENSVVADAVGNHDLQIVSAGTPVWLPTGGHDGSSALQFGGATYLRFPDASTLYQSAVTGRSVSIWFKANRTDKTQLLFEHGGPMGGMAARITKNSQLEVAVAQNMQRNLKFTIPFADTVNWHQLLIVFDRGSFKVYLDQVLRGDATTVFSSFNIAPNPGGVGALLVNDVFAAGYGSTTNYFEGLISEIKIYNVAVTPASYTTDLVAPMPVHQPNTEYDFLKVMIDGVVQSYGHEPVDLNGYAYVAVKDVIESMGGVVLWNDSLPYALVYYNNQVMLLKAGETRVIIGSKLVTLEQTPQVVEGQLMVPYDLIGAFDNVSAAWLKSMNRIGIFTTAGVEMIGDSDFEEGFNLTPTDPNDVINAGGHENAYVDKLDFGKGKPNVNPVWRLAQWWSKFDLQGAQPVYEANGSIAYENEGKKVAISPEGSVMLEVKANNEYDSPRQDGQVWPALLIAQDFPAAITPVDNSKGLIFSMEAKLIKSERYMTDNEYDSKKHTAHTPFHLVLQNMNPNSEDYGAMIWFGLPVYDYRKTALTTTHSIQLDVFSQKLIYNVPGNLVWDNTLQDGEWHQAHVDLIPLIKQAYEVGLDIGIFTNSSMEDMRITGMNYGWEVPGTFDAAIEVKNISLKKY